MLQPYGPARFAVEVPAPWLAVEAGSAAEAAGGVAPTGGLRRRFKRMIRCRAFTLATMLSAGGDSVLEACKEVLESDVPMN